MVHGRFQPFHNGHLEYLRAARDLCDTLIVGITNPDPTVILEEPTSEHRHLPESNPYTYFERLLMVREVLRDEGVPDERWIIIPFPVNSPDRWRYYLPMNAVHYLRVRDEGVPDERWIIIPFPVNSPDRWRYYLPMNAVHYLRVFSDWEQSKVDRLCAHGYQVEVLHPGIEKEIEASEVRRRMTNDEDWRALVPAAVVRVIESLRESAPAL